MDTIKVPNTIWVSAALSCVAYGLTYRLIPGLKDMFIRANLWGMDLSKTTKQKVPEAQGVVCGAVYLIIMFIFITIPFYAYLSTRGVTKFPFSEYVEFLAALLSICCMIFLGFADDVLDLRWRHKLLLPLVASLPLLMVYLVTFNLTVIIVPGPFRPLLGYSIDIGCLYYVYMVMLAVFCTNAINILAGVNGIEAGQSVVIALSVIVFNLIEINGEFSEAHIFSLYFMLPYVGVCLGLLRHNWYPSEVFVGDTFCYFSGMTFAVVAILGHFSKTMLLFMIPQVFNFLFSVPQLFHFVPCPRHRLPKYDAKSDKLHLSYTSYKSEQLGVLGSLFVKVFALFGLVDVRRVSGKDGEMWECSNMTIINLAIKMFGPTHEEQLTLRLLLLQVACSVVALFIRYPLAKVFYEKLQ